jgi:tetratricopeptide (TPR) repeat protein
VIPPIRPARPPRPRPQARSTPAPASPSGRTESLAAGAAPERPIEVNAPILAVDPLVQQGYRAFQRNDLAAARESYQKALVREPNNRDALLGLAAIDVRNGELEAAESRYLKLLEIDPRDSQATAGLVALRGRLDPVASESRLKTLIASQPESAQLYFSLGNQYGNQTRWSEAQSAYFKAYSIDPQNPDYAFNLAVSLDQLRQRKPALEYYQRALVLSEKRTPTFDLGQARSRVQELSK